MFNETNNKIMEIIDREIAMRERLEHEFAYYCKQDKARHEADYNKICGALVELKMLKQMIEQEVGNEEEP